MKPRFTGFLALFAVAIFIQNTVGQFCSTRPTLRLYAGYPSRGLAHLRPAVRELQTLLNSKGGYSLRVDGYFGRRTLAAVRGYQSSKGLSVDGIVGSLTWASLCGSSSPSSPPSPPPSGTCGSLRNPYGRRRKNAAGNRWNLRMQFVVDKIKACFKGKFSCSTYLSGEGDHPGNAADCFPGTSGHAATGQDKVDGDTLAKWLRANAGPLRVKYVIWYAKIWNINKSGEGWRQCGTSRASCKANRDHTESHRDHVHISIQ